MAKVKNDSVVTHMFVNTKTTKYEEIIAIGCFVTHADCNNN